MDMAAKRFSSLLSGSPLFSGDENEMSKLKDMKKSRTAEAISPKEERMGWIRNLYDTERVRGIGIASVGMTPIGLALAFAFSVPSTPGRIAVLVYLYGAFMQY